MAKVETLSECLKEVSGFWGQETLNFKNWKQGSMGSRSLYLLEELLKNKDRMEDLRQSFKEWYPLRVYTSWTDSTNLEFSLRFKGQMVAVIKKDRHRKVVLKFDEGLKKINKGFGLTIPDADDSNTKTTTWEWQSKAAKSYRAHYKNIFTEIGEYRHVNSDHVASETHIESLMIEEMAKTSSADKFLGKLQGLQPVLFANAPFQFPVPISPSGGDVNLGNGNIDVLARVNPSRLSIWELKRPQETLACKAHLQAYCYALAVIKMLRGPQGRDWYKVLGYSELPDSITVEAVPVLGELTADQQGKVLAELESSITNHAEALTIRSEFEGKVFEDKIEFKLVFYSLEGNADKRDPRAISIEKAFWLKPEAGANPAAFKTVQIGQHWHSLSV